MITIKKQRLPMCEIKNNQKLLENSQLINHFKRFIIFPFIQGYTHIPVPENYLSYYSIYTSIGIILSYRYIK